MFAIYFSTANSQCWNKIYTGAHHTLAIKQNGSLWAWGYNLYGQLGDSTNSNHNYPIKIGIENSWDVVQTGFYFSIGKKTNGTIWSWGANSIGQLGNGTYVDKNIPTQIGADSNWLKIFSSSSSSHSFAIKTNGTLWGWGSNSYGEVGNGTSLNVISPVQIGTDNNWNTVAVGEWFTLGLKNNGTLWAWGSNLYGQFGNGTNFDSGIPIQIGSDTNWSSISCGGGHSLAIKTNGTLWAWGWNLSGQLGDGTNFNKDIPTQIGIDTNWALCSGGSGHSIAKKTNGALYSFGYNADGELGDGTIIDKNIPTNIFGSNITQLISAGRTHSAAIDQNGNLYTWGWNGYGELGDSTTILKLNPTLINCSIQLFTTINVSACNSYSFNNQNLSASGIYYDTLLSSNSSDSIIILNLTINSINNTVTQSVTALTANETGATYQWLICPTYSMIPGATNQTYNATGNGDYAVGITKNSCTDTSNCYTVTGVGINNISALTDFVISPNPANGILVISCQLTHDKTEINIRNSLGQAVLNKDITRLNSNVDISQLPNGIYYIEINADGKTYRSKLVKN